MSLFLHYLSLPYLLEGIEVTLEVTALGLGGGLILVLILAWMQLSWFWLLSAFARGYTVIFRGTPLILQMVFAYDALPHIGIKLPAIAAAGLALACNEAPFIAEMLRSGVLGVDRGQVSAGQALGMTPAVLMRRVIAPQAIRTMIPAFGNESVSALKNSSRASVIAVQELRRAGRTRRARSHRPDRRGRGTAGTERLRQEHAASLHQSPRKLGFRDGARRRPPARLSRRRQAAVAA